MSFSFAERSKLSSKLSAKYKVQLNTKAVEFDRRLQYFKNLEPQFNILRCPFTTEVESAGTAGLAGKY